MGCQSINILPISEEDNFYSLCWSLTTEYYLNKTDNPVIAILQVRNDKEFTSLLSDNSQFIGVNLTENSATLYARDI